MATLLTMLLALALCSSPALAVRDDSNLILDDDLDMMAASTALVRRADASDDAIVGAQAGDGELDTALVRKDQGTPCVCLQELDAIGRQWFEFADMEKSYYEAKSVKDCRKSCATACSDGFGHKFGPSDAQAVEIDGVSAPVVASSCFEDGVCRCLKANQTTKKGKLYMKLGGKSADIAAVGKIYESQTKCHESCYCSDGHQRLCVGPWSWTRFFAAERFCDSESSIGLKSCSLTLQFKLETGTESGRPYEVKLEKAWDSSKQDYEFNLEHSVMSFKAESKPPKSLHRTTSVEVFDFTGGLNSKWTVKKSGLKSSSPWDATENDATDGNTKHFIISEDVEDSKWMVTKVTTSKDKVPWYYADGDADANSGKDFEFQFYRDRNLKAGKLVHKGGQGSLEVSPGEDAGLLAMTSVLISKAFAGKK